MSDLIRQFFERDLSPEERAQVKAAIESDPEAAMRLAELAAREFAETGLPEPEPPKARSWKGLALGLAVLLGLGLGIWGTLALSGSGKPGPQLLPGPSEQDQAFVSQEKPGKARPAAQDRAKAEAGLQLNAKALPGPKPSFKVMARAALGRKVLLSVSSRAGTQVLHQGELKAGGLEMVWTAPSAGQYRLRLESGEEYLERWLWSGERR